MTVRIPPTTHLVPHLSQNIASAAVVSGAAVALDYQQFRRHRIDRAELHRRARGHLTSGLGSLGGAATGAMIGSMLPLVGSALGAFVGSCLGSFAGGRLHRSLDPPRLDPAKGTVDTLVPPVTRATSTGAYAQIRDIHMYYEVHGTGPRTVLMLNGGYQTAEDYRFMLRSFPPELYTMILIDHRGRGRSDPGVLDITYETIADDVALLLDHLDLPKVHLVGHSEGGCVALELLLRHEARVATATLVGAPLEVRPADRAQYQAQAQQMKRRDASGMSPSAARMIEWYPRLAQDPSRWAEVVDRLYAGWSAQRTYADELLASISKPVLVVRTERDAVVPTADFDRAARALRARICHIPEGGHAVLMTHPAQINAAVAALIDEAPSP